MVRVHSKCLFVSLLFLWTEAKFDLSNMSFFPMCQKLEVRLCKHMPYNMTITPNLFQHQTQRDAIIAMEQFEPLIWSRCSVYLDFFLCSLYAPICTLRFNAEGIPPCQDVCEKVHRNCNHIMRRMNSSWSTHFKCSNFPVINKGVCVSPDAIMDEKEEDPVAKRRRLRESCKCKHMPRLRFNLYAERNFDYVIQADVRDIQSYGELTLTSLHVHEAFKRKHVHLISKMEGVLWTNRSCTCPPIFANREYLILGYEDVEGNKLLFTEDCMAIPWRKKYTKKIKKWNKRLYPEREMDDTMEDDEDMKPKKKGKRRRRKGSRREKWRLNQPLIVKTAIQSSQDHR